MKAKLNNHLTNLESKPLAVQFELLGKQGRSFARLSKNKNLTQKEKNQLIATWESVEALKFQVAGKIMKLKNSFSLN